MKKMNKKIVVCLIMVAVLVSLLAVPAFAAGTGDVAGAVEKTWNSAKSQIKQVTNNVIFPIVDLILAILLFVKLGTAYFDYRKHGQFEFTAPAIFVRLPRVYADRSAVHLEHSRHLRCAISNRRRFSACGEWR